MIPQAKHLNHYDLSIGEIHCIKLTRAELQRMVLECPLPILSERGATAYCAPMFEVEHKNLRKTGAIGFDKESWYEIDDETPESDED